MTPSICSQIELRIITLSHCLVAIIIEHFASKCILHPRLTSSAILSRELALLHLRRTYRSTLRWNLVCRERSLVFMFRMLLKLSSSYTGGRSQPFEVMASSTQRLFQILCAVCYLILPIMSDCTRQNASVTYILDLYLRARLPWAHLALWHGYGQNLADKDMDHFLTYFFFSSFT